MNSQPAPKNDPSHLFEQFSTKLARVAARHLDRRLAGRVDEEDIVQSAFRTFFRRNERGDFQIDSSLEIWRLLVHITVLKARAKGRYHTNSIRDVRIEVSLDDLTGLLQQDPSPDEAVALVDLVGLLLSGLPSWYCEALQNAWKDTAQRRLPPNSIYPGNPFIADFECCSNGLGENWARSILKKVQIRGDTPLFRRNSIVRDEFRNSPFSSPRR